MTAFNAAGMTPCAGSLLAGFAGSSLAGSPFAGLAFAGLSLARSLRGLALASSLAGLPRAPRGLDLRGLSVRNLAPRRTIVRLLKETRLLDDGCPESRLNNDVNFAFHFD